MHAPQDQTHKDRAGLPEGKPRRGVKRGIIAVVVLALAAVVAGAFWWKGGGSAPAKGRTTLTTTNASPVETAVAQATRSSVNIPSVGSLRSDENVQIASEIAGRIAEIRFREGEPVKQGDVLVRLDDSLAKAELSDMEARFNFQKANFERANALSTGRNITERAFDEARQNFESARAALELSRVRNSKHQLQAPFSGVVGIRTLSAGAFVSIGTPIVNLEKIDVLKLDFKIPEVFLADVQVGQTVDVTLDALPRRTFQAQIYAIDPLIDVNGRALQVRARLQNPEMLLRPGLFARVSVRGRTERNVIVVPESAIVPRAGENYIYRVENGRAVESRIEIGTRRAGNVEITDGLKAGAVVVTAGHQRLKDGAMVEVVQSPPAPGQAATPTKG